MPSSLPVIPRRSEVIAAHQAGGGQVAAVYPIHYPRALFRAHGVLPVEVWGPPSADPTPASSHIQAYACSIVRCGLSFLLTGGLDAVDLIVVPHACDSLQGLGSLLLDFERPKQPVRTFYAPRGTGESSLSFLIEEIRDTAAFLAQWTGRSPSEAEVLAAVRTEEAADAALAGLWAKRTALPLDDRAFYQLIRTREYLPAEQFIALAAEGAALAGEPTSPALPIVLSGILPEPMSVLDALSEAGATVVADDLACCGRRLYPAGKSDDPWRRMAERLQGGPPDSTRGSTVQQRVDHLLRLAHGHQARVVLFFEPKFCEPELFYLPLQRKALEAAGLRTLTVEVDIHDPLAQQVVTRLEALLETVA